MQGRFIFIGLDFQHCGIEGLVHALREKTILKLLQCHSLLLVSYGVRGVTQIVTEVADKFFMGLHSHSPCAFS